MKEEIQVSSFNQQVKIKVGTKESSNKINIDKNLTKYYSDLAKRWAVSSELVNNEDYSSKYYAQNARLEIESATKEIRQEIEENLSLTNEQVVLAKEQVNLANQAVTKAENIANSLEENFCDISLSNINQSGAAVIKTYANDMCTNIYAGMVFPLLCEENYMPAGAIICDGSEYSQELYSDFYNNTLLQGKVSFCSYEEYEQELTENGKCEKFALDTEQAKFRVPTVNSDDVFDNEGITLKYIVFLEEKTKKLETLFSAFDNTLATTLKASLVEKINVDHSNDTKPYIKETYVNGTSWYRIWSDNWCEQGGLSSAVNGANATTTVALLKQYKNTSYSCYVSIYRGDIGSYRDQFLTTCSVTTSSFKVFSNFSGSVNGSVDNRGQWYACGYI